MYKLRFTVPKTNCEATKNALFELGLGRLGNYDCVSFELPITGQFRPLAGAKPHIGQHNNIEKVEELLVEMLCPQKLAAQAKSCLVKNHPYEEPAYEFIKLEQI